jgi:F-type H+-transporting ATPase subunit gamma
MAISTRVIKGRIKSITNTKKITKAMELVSGAKMRKAVNAVLGTRPYATLAWDTILELARQTDASAHPLLRVSEKQERVLLIAIFSDRGLCGGFNAQLHRKLRKFEEQHKAGTVSIDVVAVGKRGIDAFRRSGMNVIAAFTGISNNTKWREVQPIARLAIDEFTKGTYDQVVIGYTDFESAIVQDPRSRVVLPVDPKASIDDLGLVGSKKPEEPATKPLFYEYQFEPSPDEVLEAMLPRLVETQIYQAVLESAASEHSARMMSMRSASDAAGDMIQDLQFTFNQARQSAITSEVAEITSGKAALE